MGCGGSKKSVYVLQVRPQRESLTQNISRFGLEEDASGASTDSATTRARRRSRRGSQKKLAQAAVASHGRITARAGSFGHASGLRATNWRASSFDMDKIIGTGVHAKVYLAKAKKTHHYYALKQFNKSAVVHKKRMHYLEDEMRALLTLNNTFIVRMLGTFQDERHVYFVLDFCGGGELFSYMHSRKKLGNDEAKFYLAEVVLALEAIHNQSMIYRDLKPENIVLTASGHVRLVDFGFCKEADERGNLYNKVGTAHYLAPELLNKHVDKRGYTRAVDWWAFGCLMYEMLAGKAAFGGPHDNPYAIYTRITSRSLSLPRGLHATAKSLLKALLQPDVTARLSSAYAVKHHPFFEGVDWASVAEQRLIPPFNPNLGHVGDAQHFDEYSVSNPKKEKSLTPSQQGLFDMF